MAKRAGSTGPEKKAAKKSARPRRKKGAASIKGLSAPEVTSDSPPVEIEALSQAIRESGGGVVGSYRDPAGGRTGTSLQAFPSSGSSRRRFRVTYRNPTWRGSAA